MLNNDRCTWGVTWPMGYGTATPWAAITMPVRQPPRQRPAVRLVTSGQRNSRRLEVKRKTEHEAHNIIKIYDLKKSHNDNV